MMRLLYGREEELDRAVGEKFSGIGMRQKARVRFSEQYWSYYACRLAPHADN